MNSPQTRQLDFCPTKQNSLSSNLQSNIMLNLLLAAISFLFGCISERNRRGKQDEPDSGTSHVQAVQVATGGKSIEDAEKLRHDASTHAENRGRLFDESQEAFKNGDKKEAKDLAEQGKAEAHMMEECNKEAARIYFNHNNPKNGKNDAGQVDLHWLQVKEALDYADHSLQNEINRKSTDNGNNHESERHVVFIVGMGNHSEGGIRKIKPALEEMIKNKYGFTIIDEKPHKGCISVEFDVSKLGSHIRSANATSSE